MGPRSPPDAARDDPAGAGEAVDSSHIQSYWRQHLGLVKAGVDAFWPDEGDWFNLFERIKRHQLYYQGELSAKPNVRPWSLQRNGYPGIAQWGGWVWSGDTESSWKTLEAQIAVGPQLLAEHRAATGAPTSAVSTRTTNWTVSCTRAGSSSRRSADRSARTAAPGGRACRGAGASPTWGHARTTTPTRRFPPTIAVTSCRRR